MSLDPDTQMAALCTAYLFYPSAWLRKIGILSPKEDASHAGHGAAVLSLHPPEWNEIVVNGEELDTFSAERWARRPCFAAFHCKRAAGYNDVLGKDGIVFARTQPQQKRLCEAGIGQVQNLTESFCNCLSGQL